MASTEGACSLSVRVPTWAI